MDVSSQPVCSGCGYLRTGLPLDSLCPECGGTPPTLITPLIDNVGAAADRSQQAWLATITIGLVTLFVCSAYAIQSEFFVNNGGLALIVINAPGPKLTAAACLLRQIGDPREWGVQGFMSTLGTLLGIWLVTEPHPSVRETYPFSLRRATRVVSVLTFGALFGVLISGYAISRFWGWSALSATLAAVGAVELPVNLLLYLYLASFSRRFDASLRGRPRFGLALAGWLCAAGCLSGVLLSYFRGQAEDKPVEFWRAFQTGYGILALSTGMWMTLGVARLAARTGLATLDASVLPLPAALGSAIAGAGRLVGRVRADPTRYAAASGLILWMYFTRPILEQTAWLGHRDALGGDLPAFNFIGPKFAAVPLLNAMPYARIDARVDVLATMAALWLLTTFRPARRFPPAGLVRWFPTIVIGATFGFLITIEKVFDEVHQSYWNAAAVVLVEAPATLLLYLFVANIAQSIDEPVLARRLRRMAWLAAAVVCGPLALLLISHLRLPGYRHAAFSLIGLAYGVVMVTSGITAWALVVRTTWALLAGRRLESASHPT